MARVHDVLINGSGIHKRRIPRSLLLLDAAGAVLAALGILELLQAWPRVVPEFFPYPATAIVLVALGIALMLAVPIWLLRRHRRERTHFHGDSSLEP